MILHSISSQFLTTILEPLTFLLLSTSANSGTANFDLAFSADQTSFVVTDTNPFGSTNSTPGIRIVNFNTSGAGSFSFPTADYLAFPGLLGSCWIERSAGNHRYYISQTAATTVSEVVRSGNTLTETNRIATPNGTQPADMTILTLDNSDFLYVRDNARGLISVYALGSVNVGGATLLQTVSAGSTVSLGGLIGYKAAVATTSPTTSPTTCPSTPTPTPTCATPTPTPTGCYNDDDDGVTINFYFADILRGL